RDIKPENVLLSDGVPIVADFGIARAAFEESLTVSGELLGTAAYISPEQALGEPAAAASDRYAFAVVAFEALTGGLPFGGGTLVEIAHRRTELDPPRASERVPGLPGSVDDVLLRGLAREPEARWETASDFVTGLETALDQPATVPAATPSPAPVPSEPSMLPPPPVAWSHPRRRIRPAPLLLGLAAIAVGLIVGLTVLDGGGAGGGQDRRQETRAESRERTEGRTAERRGRQESAPPAPAQEPERTNDSPAQLNDEGFQLMNAGRYDDAIPVLQRAVASYPEGSTDVTLAYALYNLGRSLRLAGRPGEAIPILERRLQFKNQRGVVRRELAAAQGDPGGGRGRGGDEDEGE
ncbi:MAG: protein kinase domain-containing protein, partial [Solirubrobacterales bacterium]